MAGSDMVSPALVAPLLLLLMGMMALFSSNLEPKRLWRWCKNWQCGGKAERPRPKQQQRRQQQQQQRMKRKPASVEASQRERLPRSILRNRVGEPAVQLPPGRVAGKKKKVSFLDCACPNLGTECGWLKVNLFKGRKALRYRPEQQRRASRMADGRVQQKWSLEKWPTMEMRREHSASLINLCYFGSDGSLYPLLPLCPDGSLPFLPSLPRFSSNDRLGCPPAADSQRPQERRDPRYVSRDQELRKHPDYGIASSSEPQRRRAVQFLIQDPPQELPARSPGERVPGDAQERAQRPTSVPLPPSTPPAPETQKKKKGFQRLLDALRSWKKRMAQRCKATGRERGQAAPGLCPAGRCLQRGCARLWSCLKGWWRRRRQRWAQRTERGWSP